MKSINTLKLAVSALFLVSASAFAAGTIVGTGHDLSMDSALPADGTVDNAQMCVYCHTPHKTGSEAPLWNRTVDATVYTLYSTTGTIDMTIGQPGDSSRLCLSCHDGANALDAIVNAPNAGWTQATTSRQMSSAANGFFGVDLSDDHPIGITYDNTASGDTAFKDASAVAVNLGGITETAALPAGKVECSSCHSVHDTTNMPFLRISNDGSALCLACHDK